MINMRYKSIIVICFIMLIIFSITGCNKAEKSPTPAATATPIPTPVQGGKASTTKADETWMKAYYDYIVDNESQYDPYLLLIDLNFDGVPELFDISIAEGSQAYRNGITFMNEKVVQLNNDKMNISVFVGTTLNTKGEKVWYTRYYPYGLHNSAGSEIEINSYNCSDLFDIAEENLFQISYENTNSDEPDTTSVNVSILQDGKSVNAASEDKQSIINWYLNDKKSDFGSDWYNNQGLTTRELNSLLPLAQFEGSLNIHEQKSSNVNLIKCHTTTNSKSSLDYKLFYNQVMSWYEGDQIKQWDFFQ